MTISSTGGTAIFCVYTEMQLAISMLYFRNFLAPLDVEPCFVLFQTVRERFKTLDLSKLPGRHFSFRNDLNQSIVFPDLSFLHIRSEKDVRYVVYPNSPILTHEVISNYFAAQQPIRRIVIADGTSINTPWPLKTRLILLTKYLLRRIINRVPHLTNKLLRSPDAIQNADVLISTETIKSTSMEFVDVQTLYAEEEHVRLVLELFRVPELELEAFIHSNLVFFGQPRYRAGIDDRTYFDTLKKIAEIIRKRGGSMVIKPHPAEDATALDFLVGDGVVVSKTPVPGEFLLSSLRDKAILSFYSSVSMMSSNESLTHIWLKNLLPNEIAANPDDKILAIKSLDEVEEILDKVMEDAAKRHRD